MAQKLYEETNIQAIANAIRAKNGLTTTYKPSEMAGAIEAIQTGCAPIEPVLGNAITFYDYDGTILHSYTLAQAQALTALPDAPAHDGLVFSGWTHTLAQIKATTTVLKVGATYATDDETTRIYIHLEDGRLSLVLTLQVLSNNTATIDWGDGTATDTLIGRGTSSTGNVSLENKRHSYAVAGDYVIKLTGGTITGSGENSNDTYSYLLRYMPVVGNTDKRDRVYQRVIKKVEMGTHTSLADYGFAICDNIQSVVISNPSHNSSIYPSAFERTHLNTIVLPNKITSIDNNAFYECYTLTNIIMSGVTSIGARAFFNCYALPNVIFPSTLRSIGNYAFYGCGGVKYYDFTACTSVPTLGGSSAFNGMPADCEIRVPASLETTWKNATNWTTYADYIVGV